MKGKLLTIEINNDNFVDLQKDAIPAAIGIQVKEFQPNILIAKCTGQMKTKDRGMKDFVDMKCLLVLEEKDASKDIENFKDMIISYINEILEKLMPDIFAVMERHEVSNNQICYNLDSLMIGFPLEGELKDGKGIVENVYDSSQGKLITKIYNRDEKDIIGGAEYRIDVKDESEIGNNMMDIMYPFIKLCIHGISINEEKELETECEVEEDQLLN